MALWRVQILGCALAIASLVSLSDAGAQEEGASGDSVVDAVDLALGGEEPAEGDPEAGAPEADAPEADAEAAGAETPPEEPQERFAPRESEGPDPRALEMYQYAEEAYSQGRYQEAVGFLEQALTFDPDAADLQYNMALVLERLGEFDEALRYLEMYRQHELDDEEQARVDRMIVRIRGAREFAPAPPEPEVRTRVVTRRFGRADGWFWSMVGATVLFAGGAIATGILALDWNDASENFRLGQDGGLSDYQYFSDTAVTLALVTDIGIGLASASALAALLLYVLRSSTIEVEAEAEAEEEPPSTDEPPSGEADTNARLRLLVPRVNASPLGVLLAWDI